MTDASYINSLRKHLRHPRTKNYRRFLGIFSIGFGVFIAGGFLWSVHVTNKIDRIVKNDVLPLLDDEGLRMEDLARVSSVLNGLANARMRESKYTSPLDLIWSGIFISLGILVLSGSLRKQSELNLTLWERIEALENKGSNQ